MDKVKSENLILTVDKVMSKSMILPESLNHRVDKVKKFDSESGQM